MLFKTLKNFFSGLGDGTFSFYNSLGLNRKEWSVYDYLNSYSTNIYLNKGLRIRAQKVAQTQFLVKKGETELKNGPFVELLKKPNDYQTGYEFIYLCQLYLDIFGYRIIRIENGGEYKVLKSKPKLHVLNPLRCKLELDKDTGELLRVEYKTENKTEIFSKEELIFSKNSNPESPLSWESLVSSGMLQLSTLNDIDTYQSRIIKNGGKVESILQFKGKSTMTDQQKEHLKQQFQEKHGDATKSGIPMMLGDDVEYIPLGLSPAELSYNETKKLLIDDVNVLTGVPVQLLGVTEGSTFSNAEMSIRIFLGEVIAPLSQKLCDDLSKIVGEGETLSFVDPTPEIKEEKRKDLQVAHQVNALTTDEKREMLGLKPLENGLGKPVLVPKSVTQLVDDLSTQPVVKEVGKEEKKEIKEEKKENGYNPLLDSSFRTLYFNAKQNKLRKNAELFKSKFKPYFQRQEKKVINSFSAKNGFKHWRLENNIDEAFNLGVEVGLAKEIAMPVLMEMLIEAGVVSKEIVGSEFTFLFTSEIRSWLDKKVEVFANTINETTFNKLKEEFAKSIAENEGRDMLIDRIKNVYKEIDDYRADMIATTETHGVTQYGTFQGYKQGGLKTKVWVHLPGRKGGIRDNHQSMDGEAKPINERFSNGLMFPGDYSGGADEVIFCECFI